MQDYDFEEEQQVRGFSENTEKPKGGNPKLDNQVRTKLSKDFYSFLSESSAGRLSRGCSNLSDLFCHLLTSWKTTRSIALWIKSGLFKRYCHNGNAFTTDPMKRNKIHDQ